MQWSIKKPFVIIVDLYGRIINKCSIELQIIPSNASFKGTKNK